MEEMNRDRQEKQGTSSTNTIDEKALLHMFIEILIVLVLLVQKQWPQFSGIFAPIHLKGIRLEQEKRLDWQLREEVRRARLMSIWWFTQKRRAQSSRTWGDQLCGSSVHLYIVLVSVCFMLHCVDWEF